MIIRSVIFETYNVIHQNGVKRDRTHNAANELQNIAAHDANGNMTLMPTLKGKYDAWNRLVEARNTNDVLIAQYEYNALNQRIKKTVGATITQSFFNENWQELESVTNNQVTTYIWGLRYVDDLILREKGNEKLYSIADPNWNVVAICDNTGDIAERIKYNAFGKITWLNENFIEKTNSDYSWNRTFTGQVLDIETGLMLYRNRYYHVELGRFISSDPNGFSAGDMNLYRYVGNSSIVFVDPYGLQLLLTSKPVIPMTRFFPLRLPPLRLPPLRPPFPIRPAPRNYPQRIPTKPLPENPTPPGQNPPIPSPWPTIPVVPPLPDPFYETDTQLQDDNPQLPPELPYNCPPPGDCSHKRHRELQKRINDNCKEKNRLIECKSSMSLGELRIRMSHFQLCAVSRDIINRECFKGGDKTHRKAAEDAHNGLLKCAKIYERLRNTI